MRPTVPLSCSLAIWLLAACSGESELPEATGKGSIRAINAIPTSPDIVFRIEERTITSLSYKVASSGARYDDLQYTFNFDANLGGETGLTRIASFPLDVVKDTSYTLVVSGSLAAPDITLWEAPISEFTEGATTFDVQFGHTAETLGAIDIYFADPATPPAAGGAVGSLTFGEILPPQSLESGDFVLTVTTAGDPADVLFQSGVLAPAGGTSRIYSVFDADANDLAPLAVQNFNLTSGSSIPVADARTRPTLRFFHANFDSGPVDIYTDDPLGTAIVAGHAFRDITGAFEVEIAVLPVTYTTAGSQGTIFIDTEVPAPGNTASHVVFAQDADGNDLLLNYVPDRRSVETFVKFTLLNTAAIDSAIDVYIVPAGDPIDEIPPLLAAVPAGLLPLSLNLQAGDFDIYLTLQDEKTPLTGEPRAPLPLSVALGDVVDLIVYENADPTRVDVVTITPP
jgi:hypothetical protein